MPQTSKKKNFESKTLYFIYINVEISVTEIKETKKLYKIDTSSKRQTAKKT